MKNLIKQFVALSLVALALSLFTALPAQATLANSNAASQHGNVLVYSALITATANDTTASALSNDISNVDGSIKDVCAGVKATNQTGTSPTLTVSFLGSHDGTTYFALTTAQGGTAGTTGTMASAALDINTASSTKYFE